MILVPGFAVMGWTALRCNAFVAVKAIAGASLPWMARWGAVSLNSVVATMRQAGAYMQSKYEETRLAGWR